MLCFNASTTHKIYLSIMKNHNSFRRQKSEKKLHSKLLVALVSIEIFITGFKQTKILWNFVNGFQICLNIFLYIRFLYIIRKGNIYCVIFFCDLDPVILASVSLWLGQIWFGTRRCRQTYGFYHPQVSLLLPWNFQIWGLWVKWKSFFSQTLIGSYRPLEPQIFVRHMIFIIPKGHIYYPENFRSEAYGLNKIHFLVFWI